MDLAEQQQPEDRLEDLRKIDTLSGIDDRRLLELYGHLKLCRYGTQEKILTRGDATEALYFLRSGQVEVLMPDDDGKQHCLATLGAGETFGERALLTGEPRTADVIACTPVEVFKLERDSFNTMLQHCPEIHANLCVKLARELGNWAIRHREDERENREVLNNLVGWQLLPEFEAFPGRTPGIRRLNQRIKALGKNNKHVLVLGERGTWKDLVARLIHFHQEDTSRPVLFLDCATPPPVLRENGTSRNTQDDDLTLKIAQESALFGHEQDSTIYARGTRRGMLELADGGDLILRNIDSLALPVQKLLADFLREGFFSRRGEQTRRMGKVRILATSSIQLENEVEAGRFNEKLFAFLQTETILLSPLRERKKDIPYIVRRLLRDLNRKHRKQVRRLSQEAQNMLVDHDWPLNGTELYQVISRAVAVCDGATINAEQIFLYGQINSVGRINLLNHPGIDHLVRKPSFPGVIRLISVPVLLALIVLTLFGPEYDNPANLLASSTPRCSLDRAQLVQLLSPGSIELFAALEEKRG